MWTELDSVGLFVGQFPLDATGYQNILAHHSALIFAEYTDNDQSYLELFRKDGSTQSSVLLREHWFFLTEDLAELQLYRDKTPSTILLDARRAREFLESKFDGTTVYGHFKHVTHTLAPGWSRRRNMFRDFIQSPLRLDDLLKFYM